MSFKTALNKFRKGATILKFGAIGQGVEISQPNFFVFPERIKIGNYVHIESKAHFEAKGGLIIADHVIIAPEVVILTSMHRYKNAEMLPYDQIDLLRSVKIERCVWIGMRAMLLPGVTIGEGSIIGAGAIVTKSCEPGSILGGNPAVKIGQRDMDAYRNLVSKGKFYLKLKRELGLKKQDIIDNK